MLGSLLNGGDLRGTLIQLLLTLPIVILSLTVHEYAHAWAAKKLGDPTAETLGRLTLNPMKHLNLFGFLAMLFFGIGWANPVPINTRYFKNPRRDMALSAAAGPLSNLLMGVLFALLYEITYSVASVIPVTSESTANVLSVLLLFLMLGSHLNVFLAVFNLLPIPPFDGSRLFYIFLPTKLYFRVMKYERYIMMGILGLLLVESWVLGGRGIMLGGISWLANFIHNGIYYLLGLIPFFRA